MSAYFVVMRDTGGFGLKYTNGLRVKAQEEHEARHAKLRPALRNILRGNPDVFP